jgi:hypothetical protein
VVLIGYAGVSFVGLVPVYSFGAFSHPLYACVAGLSGFVIGALLFTVLRAGHVPRSRWRGVVCTAVAATMGAAIAFLLLFGFYKSFQLSTDELANKLLWHERTIALSSGVTVAIPFLFLWLALYLVVRTHVQSLVKAPLAFHEPQGREPGSANNENRAPAVEFLADDERRVLSEDVLRSSKPAWPPTGLLAPLAAVAIPAMLFWLVYRAPLESAWIELVLKIGVCLVLFGLTWSLDRVISGARNLERLLRFFGSGPLRSQLEPFFATLPAKQFGRFQVLQPTVRLLAEFLQSWGQVRELPSFKSLDEAVKLDSQLAEDLRRFDTWPAWGSLSFEFLRRAATLASKDQDWPRRASWTTPQVRLIGAYLVLLVSWALGAIRTLLLLATVLALCLWIAFVSYPQWPHHLLLVAAWLAMGGCLVIGVAILLRFERNEVLSAMSRTRAGTVTFDFTSLKAIGSLLAGPVLAIVVLEFPEFGRWLSEWAQPLLRNLK